MMEFRNYFRNYYEIIIWDHIHTNSNTQQKVVGGGAEHNTFSGGAAAAGGCFGEIYFSSYAE
jgi:hypothetical protein